MAGYLQLYRRVYDNPVFADLVEASVFVWMTAQAAWQATSVRYKGKRINLERGQLAISTRDLATKFAWSEAKSRRYLTRLTSDAMVVVASGAGVNVITICNYDKYQKTAQTSDAVSDAPVDVSPTQQRRTGDAQNNKGNKYNLTLTNVSDAEAPDLLWSTGLELVKNLTGFTTDKSCRSLVGKMLKLSSNQPRKVLEAIEAALSYRETQGGIADAAGYMIACLEKEAAPFKFDPANPDHWRTYLGKPDSKYMQDHLFNNWPSDRGPNPWRKFNSNIPIEFYQSHGQAWGWINDSTSRH